MAGASHLLLSLALGPGLLLGRPEEDAVRVLEERCLRCHGPEKQKGGLRVDVHEELQATLVAGRPEESELFRRVTLPADDLDVMPATGDPLTADEVEVLRRWIEEGAPQLDFTRAEGRADLEAELVLLAELRRTTGAYVEELPGEPGSLLRVDWSLADGPPGVEALRALEPVAGRLAELSLAGCRLAPGSLEHLPLLPALVRLHLERSTLDDAGLRAVLARVPNVTYVNVHSTAITEASVDALAAVPRLERLVVHGTAFSPAALERLRASIPIVTASADLPSEPFGRGGPRRVLAADASTGRIALLRETALDHYDVLWEHEIEAIHDLQVLENGNVLFQETWTRLVEVDPRTGETVWTYEALATNRREGDGPVEVHAFRRLSDDVTLIAESGPARILEVDRSGRVRVEVPLFVVRRDPHHDTRLVRKTPVGTYLVAHEKDGVVREYDASGNVVWSYDVPLFGRPPAPGGGFDAWGDQVFAAERLPGGNTLVATGNGHAFLEVDPRGEIVWRVDQDDLPGIRLAWTTTVQVLANGNLVLGNCHAGPDQPQLIEITRDKEVVWTFRDHERFGNALSNAWVIEDAGPGEWVR